MALIKGEQHYKNAAAGVTGKLVAAFTATGVDFADANHEKSENGFGGFAGDKKIILHDLTIQGNQSIIPTNTLPSDVLERLKSGGNSEKKKDDRAWTDFIVQQSLYNSIMDDLENIKDAYDRFEYLQSRYAEITKDFEKDAEGHVDLVAQAKKEGMLDRETLARRHGESDAQYKERIMKELENKVLNADGTLKDEYKNDRLALAIFVHKRMEQERLLAHNNIKSKMKDSETHLGDLNTRLLLLKDAQKSLADIAMLPTMEEQQAALEKLKKENKEAANLKPEDKDGNGILSADEYHAAAKDEQAKVSGDVQALEADQVILRDREARVESKATDDLIDDFETKDSPDVPSQITNKVTISLDYK